MPFEFKLPDLGEGVHEGEIVKWLVSEGDTVVADQPVVEVLTDKVTAELPCPVAGRVLELRGRPGEVVEVGTPLVVVDTEPQGTASPAPSEPQAEAPKPAPTREPRKPEITPVSAPVHERNGPPLAVPAVRRLARELGVDLTGLSGSGPGGRILEADVRAAAETPSTARAEAREPVGTAGEPSREAEDMGPRSRRIPLRGLRRVISEHLLSAHRNTAPYTYVEEADFTELVGLRERVQPMAGKAGVKMTFLPFVIAAVGMALRQHPYLNAVVDEESGDLIVCEEQHVGIAVHTEDGLIVPVIRNVERRNLLDLAREIERLSAAAREQRLERGDTRGGTFSVTSLGRMGGVMATPMLNTPQVAVLGIHKIAPRPVVHRGETVVRQMGNLSLTLDHRYIDGYVGAAFAQTLKEYLEDPAVMLFWLAEMKPPA